MKHATCRPSFLDDDNYTCVCPAGFTGAMCNEGKKCLLKSVSLYDVISLMDQWPCFKKASGCPQFDQMHVQNSCIIRFRLLFIGITRYQINFVPRFFLWGNERLWERGWVSYIVHLEQFQMTVQNSPRLQLFRWWSDWLQNPTPAFQSMRSKTKTNRTLYGIFAAL